MVCTGDTIIFGVQMTLSDAIKYLLKYFKSKVDLKSYKEIKEEFEYFEENETEKYEIVDYIEKLLSYFDLSIEIIRPRCCLFSHYSSDDFSLVYLGVELCFNCLVSRFNSKKFNTIEEYENFYTKGLVGAKKLLEENKNKYLEDLGKIIPKTKNKPKIYTIPNDCFSCT